jgi:hypothetical protein
MSIILNIGKKSGIGSSDGRITKISKLKKGDIFRKSNGKQELVYNGKVRVYTKWGDPKGWGYSFYKYWDVNDYGEVAKDIDVIVDFTF